MATHSSILAWKMLWTKSLTGYNPWGCKESEMTTPLTHIGNLQYWVSFKCSTKSFSYIHVQFSSVQLLACV